MNTNRITVRYAKALYGFATEQKKDSVVKNDMELISEFVKISEFQNMLENPIIFPSKKSDIFISVFKNKICDVTLKFFKLLSENKREAYLGAIARNYIDIYRKKNNIKSAELLTAFTPDSKLKKDVSQILSEKFKSKIELTGKTDESIIGGFVLTVDGMQYNSSIAEKLKDIKNQMMNI